MVKYSLGLFFLGLTGFAQTQASQEPKEVVMAFFKAFHEQDTLALRSLVYPSIDMQSISHGDLGEVRLVSNTFKKFLGSIASIPKTTHFEERVLDYETCSDGQMAQVWTPYTFYVNGKLSHCGTNSFQLLYEADTWKIFYIVDTRKKTTCK